MKPSLQVGLKHRFSYRIPRDKTVPFTYPESRELAAMPEVFATGFMIILMEWTCVQLLAPHLDAGEGSLGVGVNVSHLAATPPGFTVTVDAELIAMDGRKLGSALSAHAGAALIGGGTHQRAIAVWEKFNAKVAEKAAKVPA